MEITADFRDVVVVLVSSVDRAVGLRHRVDVIDAREEPLPRAEIQSLLNLRCKLGRPVDDACEVEAVWTVRVRPHRSQQICSASITRVEENLRETLVHPTANLVGLIDPVLHLRWTEPGRLDSCSGLTATVVRDDLARRRRTEIDSELSSVSSDIGITRFLLIVCRIRGVADRILLRGRPFLPLENLV